MNIAVIPARGGSTRIPRKNIKHFCGKPMLAWSIEAAQKSRCFDLIVVSTDDEEIAAVARDYGATVPFMRPTALADNYTGTTAVIRHTVQWMLDSDYKLKNICCIYATAPFIQPTDLQKSLDQLNRGNSAFVFSTTSFPFPVQRAIIKTENGGCYPMFPEHIGKRSQDLEEAFHDAGQFYWAEKPPG
ncbi:pseudaminic acid cytidylyltransferase [Nitrincola sp. A-D6]|uniref:pseudaminic acid cytidylyltransferase n=1 Tax=Nitrincola sp. A-D6 TaxID=1545442 RepID=UPI000A629A20|nr:pseudaminic acid cytidylyltransferase [Nitrincola sp. A-D6]